MQTLRTIKREWKAFAAIGCFLVLFAACVRELYSAWAFGTIGTRTGSVAYEADPTLFTGIVAFFLVALVAIGALLVGSLWGWSIEQRSLQRRAAQPPLDNAMREPLDRNR